MVMCDKLRHWSFGNSVVIHRNFFSRFLSTNNGPTGPVFPSAWFYGLGFLVHISSGPFEKNKLKYFTLKKFNYNFFFLRYNSIIILKNKNDKTGKHPSAAIPRATWFQFQNNSRFASVREIFANGIGTMEDVNNPALAPPRQPLKSNSHVNNYVIWKTKVRPSVSFFVFFRRLFCGFI